MNTMLMSLGRYNYSNMGYSFNSDNCYKFAYSI